ncbi:hypothetical protein SCALM49S_05803 [Streptomyces californicus]
MFMEGPRRNPTSVSPASAARSTASDDGAETAASAGIPAITAFCAGSNEARPETSSTARDRGSRWSVSARPTSLSTALCRPTSSRTSSSSPSSENNAAACRPPVRSKTRCAARSRSGRADSSSGGIRTGGASATGCRVVVRTASRLALPHRPHDEVV